LIKQKIKTIGIYAEDLAGVNDLIKPPFMDDGTRTRDEMLPHCDHRAQNMKGCHIWLKDYCPCWDMYQYYTIACNTLSIRGGINS